MQALEFVVLGTPMSAQASTSAKRLWQQQVAAAATAAVVPAADDIQVIDLIASMRPKIGVDLIPMSSVLATGFAGDSDFVYVTVQTSVRLEVFNDSR